MPWLLDEDEALKKAVSGVVVSDRADAARAVPVYFGLPDIELRQQSYPYITIDLLDIEEARERVHVGEIEIGYVPEGFPVPEDSQAVGIDDFDDPIYPALVVEEWPTPFDLTYQLTTWARHPRHDRQILFQLLGQRIPVRSGQVTVAGSIDHNSTVRRLDMLGVAKRDTLDGDRKRLFRNVVTLRMSSELFPSVVPELLGRVLAVDVRGLQENDPEYPLFTSITF